VQSQVRLNGFRFPEKTAEAKPGQVHRLASQHASERFVKIKRCGYWGYHRSFFFGFQLLPSARPASSQEDGGPALGGVDRSVALSESGPGGGVEATAQRSHRAGDGFAAGNAKRREMLGYVGYIHW